MGSMGPQGCTAPARPSALLSSPPRCQAAQSLAADRSQGCWSPGPAGADWEIRWATPWGHGKPTELEGWTHVLRDLQRHKSSPREGPHNDIHRHTDSHTQKQRYAHSGSEKYAHRHTEIPRDAEIQSHTDSQIHTQDTRRLMQTDTQRDVQTYAPHQLCDSGTLPNLSETQSYHLSNGHHNVLLVRTRRNNKENAYKCLDTSIHTVSQYVLRTYCVPGISSEV